jgi:hypothetical protein
MVEIKLHPLLAKRAASRQESRTVAYQPGLTPLAVLTDEGFSELDAEAVMILRNDVQIEPETLLNDGDRVEFMVGIQGGNGEREARLPIADCPLPASDRGASQCVQSS